MVPAALRPRSPANRRPIVHLVDDLSQVPVALLARVFTLDLSRGPKCHGPLRMLDAVTDPDKIALYLHGARAPPRPSPPEQLSLLAG